MKTDHSTMASTARVRVDKWGVPHISAGSAADVFFAQGYVVARDRLFQLDLWRRRGLGLMSEAFGPEHIERDAAARQFLYRGPMGEEWTAYGPDAEQAVRSFVAGINARVEEVLSQRVRRPVEFERFGYDPLRWNPEDVVRIRRHGLFDNARAEVTRTFTLLKYGADIEDLRRVREPNHPLSVPDIDTLRKVFPEALRTYDLAKESVGVISGIDDEALQDGSNSWVVSGSRTTTGRPILANDPHRLMTVPSLRYLVHLECPEFNVIGAGEPMLPGISLGHNADVAFGLTIFPTDQEDVYVYDVDDTGLHYAYDGGWESFLSLTEQIPVKGESHRSVELKFTRHGPVTGIREDDRVACAVRAKWLDTGMAPYLGSLRYLRARTVDEFEAALEFWGAPSVNQVYADTEGRIGWHACGKVPAREWDGLLPVPGDGRFEWDGDRRFDDFPGLRDPESGWIATANEHNLSKGGRNIETNPVGFEWMAPYRYQRIAEVLDRTAQHSLDDSAGLQSDTLSLPAAQVIDRLETCLADSAENHDFSNSSILRLLREWDQLAEPTSPGAGAFEAWFRGPLLSALVEERVSRLHHGYPEDARAVLEPDNRYALPHDPRPALMMVEDLFTRDRRALRSIFLRTLAQAQERLSQQWGSDPRAWTLGALQQVWLRHPGHPDVPEDWSTPPQPRGGTPDTIDITACDPQGYQTIGASVRLVVDVGNWDACLAINTPGQSGDPEDSHYSDLLELWGEGGMFPLCFSDEAIEQNLEIDYIVECTSTVESTKNWSKVKL